MRLLSMFEVRKKQLRFAFRGYLPRWEEMERRTLLSFADGNGPVVTAMTEAPGSKQLVITFDGPLNPGPAQDTSNYQITKALANPELVTSSGPASRSSRRVTATRPHRRSR